MEEAGLGRVADPGEGAGVIEALTDSLARAAWDCIQALEAEGGALNAIKEGSFAGRIFAARDRATAEVARRRITLVGVTDFADLTGASVPGEPWPAGDDAAASSIAQGDKAALALTPCRLAEPFETLRAHAPARATVTLATLGTPKSYAARMSFARSLLAAGGLTSEAAPVAEALGAVAVLCGSDDDYAGGAAPAAQALKARGVKAVWLAGRPGDREAEWRDAGVDGFLYAGGDALSDLRALQAGAAS